MEISVSIIVHNEETNLNSLLKNIKDFADEIVVIDCSSTDNSKQIALKYADRVFTKKNNPNLNINKQFGINNCTKDWILYLDPDERLTDELKKEIKEKIETSAFDAYYIPRLNYILGKPLKYGGHFPDSQLRLFKNGKAKFPCQHVHEKLKVNGKIGKLKNYFLHYPYNSVNDFIKKLEFYSDFQSDFLFKNNEKINFYKMFIRPAFRTKRKLFFKLGILDGIPGIVSIFFDFFFQVITYAKLWEKYN